MSTPWFQRFPGLLEEELQALRDAGIAAQVRKPERSEGVLVVDLSYPRDDAEPLNLTATFPAFYPYFRPAVILHDHLLPRHQNPFTGDLCLLDRPTAEWDPDWTLARLLEEQVPKVLREGAITDPDAMREGEQAEPVTDFYTYKEGTSFLIDPPSSLAAITSDRSGRLLVGLKKDTDVWLRGAVLQIQTEDREIISELDAGIAEQYPYRIGVHWVRFDKPPNPASIEVAVHKQFQHLLTKPQNFKKVQGGRVDVLGIVFPEEVEPGRFHDGWLFRVVFREGGKGKSRGYYARAYRCGEDEFTARIPELAPLRTKTVAVVGVGCIGAPSALEFARAGVGNLRLLDYDRVDPAATVRWPLGLPMAGVPKVEALRWFIAENYPRTTVTAVCRRLGVPAIEFAKTEEDVLAAFLEGADLLFDASAEWGLAHLLSHKARAAGIPYVHIGGRNGGWGGVVFREGRGLTDGCWGCYVHSLADGTIQRPPHDDGQHVQPTGCADPTFTGANFDLREVALMGVRLAVATLCREAAGGYPDYDWDVGVLSLRSADGNLLEPTWRTYPLTRHPDCARCSEEG